MPLVTFKTKKFQEKSTAKIALATQIIGEYQEQGYDLTVRQLYYQMVARAMIPNNVQSYKRLVSLINDARLAGLIDWLAIVDRTRALKKKSHWSTPASIIESAADSYRIDKWKKQTYRPECFTPDTPVLTPDGFVPIGSIKVGDWVIAGDGLPSIVERIYKRPYSGELSVVKAVGLLPVKCTPEHPILARRCDISRPGLKGAERKFLPETWVKAGGLSKFDLLAVPRLPENASIVPSGFDMVGGARSRILANVPLDRSLLEVVGIYLAEGCVRADGRTAQFTIHAEEHEQLQILQRWADSVGITLHTVTSGNARQVYLYSKSLCIWLEENFDSGSHKKRLPQWFINLPDSQQLTALKWYFLGDGSKTVDSTRSAIVISTRSEQLARQWQMVLISVGFPATVHTVSDHGAPMYRFGVSGLAGVELAEKLDHTLAPKGEKRSKRYNHIKMTYTCSLHPVRSIDRIEYTGNVINLEVADRHTYCVPFVVHNCWIEKDALTGVISGICKELDIPYFSCRGYTSASAMWEAGYNRLYKHVASKQTPVIIHLGDHDPSGIDMTRDIKERLTMFSGAHVEVKRIALNEDQIEEFNPPPNPTKLSDSRAGGYIVLYGYDSWELDALDPKTLTGLIENTVLDLRDEDEWNDAVEQEEDQRKTLETLSERYEEISAFLDNLEGTQPHGGLVTPDSV